MSLHETFRAYVAAEGASTRAFLRYKFGEVTEAEVHRLQRVERETHAAHLAAINAAREEAPPPCQTGSDGASRPERGQP